MRPRHRSQFAILKKWHLRLERSKRWGWAAPLLEHPWAIKMTLRWTAVVVVALAVSWWLLVPAADWLAHHDVGSASGSLLQTARDAARGRFLTLGAGLFAAGVLVYTIRTFNLSRQSQVTDRYTKAVEQLGSDKFDVRIASIYALERIARDSKRDHPIVMEVLTAFVRVNSREQSPLPNPGPGDPLRLTRPDLQVALTVIGRRLPWREVYGRPIDLAYASLVGADLTRADLRGAILSSANFSNAVLSDADLSNANLRGAVLSNADLSNADVRNADLSNADLRGAILGNADLSNVILMDARWPENVLVPPGWQRDTASTPLKAVETSSGH